MIASASDVLAAHWDGRLPVKVGVIAQALGLRVAGVPDLEGASGIIRVLEDGAVQITYNRSEALVRQRFTVAHEIGHHVLGHLRGKTVLLRDQPTDFSTSASSSIEREANAFAADLLMPDKTLRFAVDQQRILDMKTLAQLFGVSQLAMRYRLQNLGLLRG